MHVMGGEGRKLLAGNRVRLRPGDVEKNHIEIQVRGLWCLKQRTQWTGFLAGGVAAV